MTKPKMPEEVEFRRRLTGIVEGMMDALKWTRKAVLSDEKH